MKTTLVLALLGCLIAGCATPPSTETSDQAAQTQSPAVDTSTVANEPKKVSESIFSDLTAALSDSKGIDSQYLPDDSIQLRLAGDNAFAFGSANVRPDQVATLEKVTAILQRYPQSHIEIVGYTDNVGAPQYNKMLSSKRAESVADIFVKQGIPATAIQTRGEGADKPVADNRTSAGRSQNRRVEIYIQDKSPV
jgi:outer membrane protein OmpA-like peptidoglycan-associated protein